MRTGADTEATEGADDDDDDEAGVPRTSPLTYRLRSERRATRRPTLMESDSKFYLTRRQKPYGQTASETKFQLLAPLITRFVASIFGIWNQMRSYLPIDLR